MTIGDLIKAAIESVAYSLCLPYFTMLLLRRWWCAGRGPRAGCGAGRCSCTELAAAALASDPRRHQSWRHQPTISNQQESVTCQVSRVTCHTRAVSPSSLPWWRSTPRPSTACCPASTADSSSPKLRPVTVNVRRKGRTM